MQIVITYIATSLYITRSARDLRMRGFGYTAVQSCLYSYTEQDEYNIPT